MHVLTFDIEDWFHILDNTSTQTEADWLKYPVRIHQNLEKIFSMLEGSEAKATFFILGWIARRHPEIVKKISDAGYDIGTHSDMHMIAYQQDRQAFQQDLQKSIRSLEDLTGKKIISYRAPGFSIKEENKWAFECLVEEGIEIDCSIFPAKRAHGGFENFGMASPCWIQMNGIRIKEFPMNLANAGITKFIFSGGGYFRLFPYAMLRKFFSKRSYLMTYFHPRDFDPGQPVIKELSSYRKFKCYYGLKDTERKLSKILRRFEFTDVAHADKMIDWDTAVVKKL